MSIYRRYYLPDRTVFVTIVTHQRSPWLGDPARVETLRASMQRVKELHPFQHCAHVILPDHLHWMFRPIATATFSDIVAAVKRDVTWRLKEQGMQGPLWQKRFYDHLIRDDRDFASHLDYIHYNPVRHGLTNAAADYPHSSFVQWLQRGVYDVDWGLMEPHSLTGWNLE